MWRSALLMLLVGAMALAQDPGDGDEVYPPEGTEAVGITPEPENFLLNELEVYFPMEETGNNNRLDFEGGHDLVFVSGTGGVGAAHLGNGLIATAVSFWETTTWPGSGATQAGRTYIWWFNRDTSGAPTVSSIWKECIDATCVAVELSLATTAFTSFIAGPTVAGRPSGNNATPALSLSCDGSPTFCFFALVIDGENVTFYQGDDTGEALSTDTATLTSGDLFTAGAVMEIEAKGNGEIIDDFSVYARAFPLTDIELAYNLGAGNAIYP